MLNQLCNCTSAQLSAVTQWDDEEDGRHPACSTGRLSVDRCYSASINKSRVGGTLQSFMLHFYSSFDSHMCLYKFFTYLLSSSQSTKYPLCCVKSNSPVKSNNTNSMSGSVNMHVSSFKLRWSLAYCKNVDFKQMSMCLHLFI